MTIDVTAQDIDRGCKLSPYHCPLALAVSRALSGRRIAITACVRVYSGFSTSVALALPETARNFRRRFDQGDPVEPFSFELSMNEEANQS